MNGIDNPTYDDHSKEKKSNGYLNSPSSGVTSVYPSLNLDKMESSNSTTNNNHNDDSEPIIPEEPPPPRDVWGHDIQFLMSCIAMSVGLGNVWRFPFTALENGGGAFLIPYIIVLIVIGRPLYYVEMVIGQFSSRGSVKVYDFSPAMRGIGYAQIIAVGFATSYYAALMAIIASYFVDSFMNPLPWSYCRPEWNNCLDAAGEIHGNNISAGQAISSAEFYFVKEVLSEVDTIEYGIGVPGWRLTVGLIFTWIVISLVLIKGVRSSGKAAYFLAIFPYVVMIILLIRAVTLPGSVDGILFFITPQWSELLRPQVWYAAVTQCFFSLSVCFGNIIMYASYNKFSHNIYRDATIVTTLDTFTSVLAGVTIFGVLGHLAHEMGTDDIASVVKGGPGLVFISYPDAIARFDWVPQVFSVLFFFMLFVLGIGSNIAIASCVITAFRDRFPSIKAWHGAIGAGIVGTLIGLVYVTPGGQYVLSLVDSYGVSFIAIITAVFELAILSWVYGINRLCADIKFMSNRNTGPYWRLCWTFITPVFILVIIIYSWSPFDPPTYNGYIFPESAYAAGWVIAGFGVLQIPFWMIYVTLKSNGNGLKEKITNAFRPSSNWGPRLTENYQGYLEFLKLPENEYIFERVGFFKTIKRNLFGLK